MMQITPDRYVKVLLTIIAVLLGLLVGKNLFYDSLSSAEAAKAREEVTSQKIDAQVLQKFEAPGVQDVIILGDQKTFIVRAKDYVTVVRVDTCEVLGSCNKK